MKVTINTNEREMVRPRDMVVGHIYRNVSSGAICFPTRNHNNVTSSDPYIVFLNHGCEQGGEGIPATYGVGSCGGQYQDLGPLELCIE